MFRLRTAFATLALIVGLGSTSHAQMFIGQGMGGLGSGGFAGGYGGFGGYQQGFNGIQFGMGGTTFPYNSGYGYGNGYGYSMPMYRPYGYYRPVPQTYNAIVPLMNSIESSTGSRDGWRRRRPF